MGTKFSVKWDNESRENQSLSDEEWGTHFCIFQEWAKSQGSAIKTVKSSIKRINQPLISMTLNCIYIVDRNVPNMILQEIASSAFYFVNFQSWLFPVKALRRSSLCMGKFVEVVILIIRDYIRKAKMLWVKISFRMDRTRREVKTRVKQEVIDSQVVNFI